MPKCFFSLQSWAMFINSFYVCKQTSTDYNMNQNTSSNEKKNENDWERETNKNKNKNNNNSNNSRTNWKANNIEKWSKSSKRTQNLVVCFLPLFFWLLSFQIFILGSLCVSQLTTRTKIRFFSFPYTIYAVCS